MGNKQSAHRAPQVMRNNFSQDRQNLNLKALIQEKSLRFQDYPGDVVETILAMAAPEDETPGDSALLAVPGAGLLQVHFDGKGAVMMHPRSSRTPGMKKVILRLKARLGARFSVGVPVDLRANCPGWTKLRSRWEAAL